MWTSDLIDETRVKVCPPLQTIVVGVDPSGSADGDEQGIVVAGITTDRQIYILGDETAGGRVEARYARIIKTVQDYKANRVIVEANYGGDNIVHAIRQTEGGRHLKIDTVHVTRGKRLMAEPVAVAWASGDIHIVGTLETLEGQMISWTEEDESPNNLDAMVRAVTGFLNMVRVSANF